MRSGWSDDFKFWRTRTLSRNLHRSLLIPIKQSPNAHAAFASLGPEIRCLFRVATSTCATPAPEFWRPHGWKENPKAITSVRSAEVKSLWGRSCLVYKRNVGKRSLSYRRPLFYWVCLKCALQWIFVIF